MIKDHMEIWKWCFWHILKKIYKSDYEELS